MSELEKINKFAIAMLNAASIDDLLWSIAQHVGHTLGFEDCVIYLREGDDMVQKAAFGIKNPTDRHLLNEISIPIGQGIVGTVAKSQIPEIVPNTRADKRYIWDEFSGQSELTVPVVYEGKVIAILDSESEALNGYTEHDKEILQVIANIAAPRIASAQYCETLKKTQNLLRKSNAELTRSLKQIKDNQENLVQTEKMASVGLLSAGVAHEINNPLAFSISNLSYVKDVIKERLEAKSARYESSNAPNESDYNESLTDVLDALNDTENGLLRIKNIVDDLKCYTRKTGTIEKNINLNESIQSALKLLSGHLKTRCHLSLDLNNVPPIEADQNKLQQVLINLVINAKQAVENGGKISIKTYTRNNQACFEVSDNGSGIEEQHINNIFNPFFTTKPAGQGTGLGLFVCYKIIKEEHNGTIKVNCDDTGTTFSVSLPVMNSQHHSANQTQLAQC